MFGFTHRDVLAGTQKRHSAAKYEAELKRPSNLARRFNGRGKGARHPCNEMVPRDGTKMKR
jgi:hypothetical protein